MRVRRPTQHALHMHAVRALCMVHGMLVVLLCAPAGLMQLGCDGVFVGSGIFKGDAAKLHSRMDMNEVSI